MLTDFQSYFAVRLFSKFAGHHHALSVAILHLRILVEFLRHPVYVCLTHNM